MGEDLTTKVPDNLLGCEHPIKEIGICFRMRGNCLKCIHRDKESRTCTLNAAIDDIDTELIMDYKEDQHVWFNCMFRWIGSGSYIGNVSMELLVSNVHENVQRAT